ncbi:uncharacterized protein V6R79_020107 [Siganus canaliculatus]
MSWMLSIWVAAALLTLCRGENTVGEEISLSTFGYHLCIRNETKNVTFLAMHKDPYTVTRACGDWLLLKTCTFTLYRMTHRTEYKTVEEQVIRCCDGYLQLGRYCALHVNRTAEFTTKPGSCPAAEGASSSSADCQWDIDCPDEQKCCRTSNRSLCCDPASFSKYSENGGFRFNVTVTVKADYEDLMAKDGGHVNHIRLLQAMVTGALQSFPFITVYYLQSRPVHPYRTATSLLLVCKDPLSLHNVTSKLHLLLKHIQEVSLVTVDDVDECAQSALRQCSPQAVCNNTVGSYQCACHQGYIDVDPSNPGAHCIADTTMQTPTEPLGASLPPMNTTYTQASNTSWDPQGNSTTAFCNSTETSMMDLSNTTSAPLNSSHVQHWTSPASMNSTIPPPPTACPPPGITGLRLTNVTGTSFCVSWSHKLPTNQTFQVVVSRGSQTFHVSETSRTMVEVRGLMPGVLYNVSVTPCACGSEGITLHILVRTDAQTLDATARLTNVEFTEDLQNSSSQAYKNLTEGIREEISKSPKMKAMLESGQARIEIRGFSPGSVVVNFTIIFTTDQGQDSGNVSAALLHSLMNSSIFTVDINSTSINDFDECASVANDCSKDAICRNTWGSYTCVCLDGFLDNNRERPGRACEETGTPAMTTTVNTRPFSQMTPTSHEAPSFNNMSTLGTTTSLIPTSEMTSTTVLTTITATTTSAAPPITAPATATTSLRTTTAVIPATAITHPSTTTIAPATAITDPTTTTITPATAITDPTTITITSATAITEPTTISTTPTTAITNPTTTTITPATAITNPTTTTIAPATAITDPTTITITPTTAITDPTTTTIAPATAITDPTTTTIAPATAIADPTTITITSATAITDPTTTTMTPTRNLSIATDASMFGVISVQCRLAAITVTVVKDFLKSNKIRESSLYLGSQKCGVNGGNTTHVQLTVTWNDCASRLKHNETHYTASVTLFNTMDRYVSSDGNEEVPRIRLEVPIMCTYMKSVLISANHGSMGYDMIKDVIVSSGSFQVTVQLMNGTVPLPHNYSLSRDEAVVVDVSLNTSSENITVVINKCWTTPTQNPVDTRSYVFLENSCSLNVHTKVLMNGNSSTSRVSVQIFSLVDLDVIYLHCQVQICAQIGADTCVPDCLRRTARFANTLGTAFGSSGPLLKSDDDEEQGSDSVHIIGMACLGVGLALFFIIGFVCLFYYQRNRIGHYNFSTKPKQENFTYLVFNT